MLMAHELSRLISSLKDEPQLLLPQTYENYLDILNDRSVDVLKANQEAKKLALDSGISLDSREEQISGNVGILNIEGPLTYKNSGIEALCGGCNYTDLEADAKSLFANPQVDTVVQMINSGGGSAFGAFVLGSQLRQLADQSGKRLITYVDGMSASAAYALGCASHEIVMHPDAEVGSIGVVVRLVNSNEADKKAGIETTYITAGDSKVPFDANGEFRSEFKEDLQSKVDSLYLDFINHVATMRNISPDTVMDTEAKMFMKDKAIELGLADKVMTPTQFQEYLQESISVSATTQTKAPIAFTNDKQEIQMSDANLDVQALAELQAKLEAANNLVAQFEAKEVEAKKAGLVASLSTENTFLESDTVEALASVLLSGDEKAQSLLTSVLAQANAGITSVEAKAVEDIAAAQLATEEALAAKEAIKAEFGEKQASSPDAPVEAVVEDKNDIIAQKVAAKKAALAAAKAQ